MCLTMSKARAIWFLISRDLSATLNFCQSEFKRLIFSCPFRVKIIFKNK